MNVMVELPPQGTKAFPALMHRPGLKSVCTLGAMAPTVSTLFTSARNTYAVQINALYKLNNTGGVITPSLIGSLADGPYDSSSIASSESQLFIAKDNNGYIWDGTTLTPISSPGFLPDISSVTQIDGFFLILSGVQIGQSALNDGLTWDALAFGEVNSSDLPVRIITDGHSLLWVFCQEHVEVWSNQGTAPFAFAPIAGAKMQTGCIAPLSVVALDNTLFWLGADTRGNTGVFRANGFSPQSVSNPAIDTLIASFPPAVIAAAEGLSYVENHHAFYQISFPNGTCLAYDVSTGQWHDRAFWDSTHGVYTQHLAIRHTFNSQWNMHLVGGDASNKIYQQSMSFYDDDGAVMRRQRAAPVIWNAGRMVTYYQILFDMETGSGKAVLLDGNGKPRPPVVFFDFSDDGGQSFGNEQFCSMGNLGQRQARVMFGMLGSARKRTYRLTQTDPVPTFWTGAYLNAKLGLN